MKQGIKKGLSTAVSVALVTSMMLGTGKSYTANAAVKDDYKEMLNMPLSKEVKEKILSEITSTKVNPIETNVAAKEVNLDEVIRVMVELDGTSALDKVEKGEKANSKDVKNIEESQKPIITQIEKLGGTVRHQYASVINGLSVEIRRGDVDKLKAIKGVSKVTEATCYAPQMETAKDLTQAEAVWKNYSLKGEGMVVAVIDTGIDYMHEAMRAPADKSKEKLSLESIKAIKAKGVLKADNNVNTYYTEKIPFAYNYADRSSIVKDKEVSAHGMHVAGIIAANGTDEKVNADKSVKGVAPEAQILAMKVFSNNPAVKGCYADDVVAAIEDAVALGADVINMSLGSPAGFVNGENVEQEAIRKAVDAGVTVVVSAGNSGHSIYYSTNPKYNDVATVGSPALAKDALMVASYENVRKKSPVIKFNDEKGNVVGYYEYNLRADKDIRPLLNQGLEIVNCGLGKEGDFKEDLNGKIALIKRGEITFTEKIANAEKKGAVAVILYNRDGDNTAMGMAIEPQIKIPSTSIGNAGGAIIAKALSEGKKIKTGTGEDFVPNVNYLDFASSSSWGPSPSLDFKPQIAAPGASIFSTYNDSLYGMMSGTSMAAPHVSGGMALILEAIKGYAPELKGRELVELAKNIAMNTSEVKMDKFNKGVPVSPRRQGAGLMQIENAIKDRVVATSNGQSSVALKEIKGNKATFKIDLRNIGSTDVKYTLENVGGVLTQNNKKMVGTEPNMVCDEILPKEQANLTFSSNDIVVPAKGKASVEVTLNIASAVSTERFLEGFVRFNANDKETPSIVMPFIGFYGDWSKESILNNWIWDEEKTSFVASIQSKPDYKDFKVESCLTTKNGKEEKKTILGLSDIDKDKISYYAKENVAISPNDDKLNDFVIPELYLMRNIKEMKVEILDKDKNVVRDLSANEYITKNTIVGKDEIKPKEISTAKWDGMLYDKFNGNLVKAPEGQYYYRFTMKIDYENAKPQVVEVPVKVDVTAPTLKVENYKILEEGKARVYFSAKDNLAGANFKLGIDVFVNKVRDKVAEESPVGYDEATKLYYIDVNGLKKDSYNTVELGVADNAMNLGGTNVRIKCGEVGKTELKLDLANGGIFTSNNKYTISGKLSNYVKTLVIGGKEITDFKFDDKGEITFKQEIESTSLKEGTNYIAVNAIDLDGSVVANYSFKVYRDTIVPELRFTSGNINVDTLTAIDGQATIEGIIADPGFGYSLYVNGTFYKDFDFDVIYRDKEKSQSKFKVTLNNLKSGDIVTLKVKDYNDNEKEIKLRVK